MNSNVAVSEINTNEGKCFFVNTRGGGLAKDESVVKLMIEKDQFSKKRWKAISINDRKWFCNNFTQTSIDVLSNEDRVLMREYYYDSIDERLLGICVEMKRHLKLTELKKLDRVMEVISFGNCYELIINNYLGEYIRLTVIRCTINSVELYGDNLCSNKLYAKDKYSIVISKTQYHYYLDNIIDYFLQWNDDRALGVNFRPVESCRVNYKQDSIRIPPQQVFLEIIQQQYKKRG